MGHGCHGIGRSIHNAALKISIGAFKSSPVLSIINLTSSILLEKRRIKNILENTARIIIAIKNPTSTILKNSISQGLNNNLNNLGTQTVTYASDLNIDFTNLLSHQKFEQPP